MHMLLLLMTTLLLLINKVFNGSLTLRNWRRRVVVDILRIPIIDEELTSRIIVALLECMMMMMMWFSRDTREGRRVGVGSASGCSSSFKLFEDLIIELVGIGIFGVG